MARIENLNALLGQTVTYQIAHPPSMPVSGVLKLQDGRRDHYLVDLGQGRGPTFWSEDVTIDGTTITNIS